MPLALASVPSTEPGADLHAAYLDYLERTGRGNTAYWRAARVFFERWPDPHRWAEEPLEVRLAATSATRPIISCTRAWHRDMTTCWNASSPASGARSRTLRWPAACRRS